MGSSGEVGWNSEAEEGERWAAAAFAQLCFARRCSASLCLSRRTLQRSRLVATAAMTSIESLSPTALLSAVGDVERSTALRLESQLARFDRLLAELKQQLATLAPLYQRAIDPSTPAPDDDVNGSPSASAAALSPLLQHIYLLFLELKSLNRALTHTAEQTKQQLHAVRATVRHTRGGEGWRRAAE